MPDDVDPEQLARTICLRLLTGAPRTRAQLAAALAKRGVPQAAAEAVLDRFVEVGLVDDAAYADAWVTSRHAGRGLARRALGHELRQRGVGADHVAAALAQIDVDDEVAAAAELVRRRMSAPGRLPREVRERRLVGMLARKGYAPALALRVVREQLDAADESVRAGHGGGSP